ncbi:AMP-binding protein [Propionivibrio sp.]|uniref:class I adenylate-forming enzyme family protein n=2 Tax=Propionivibrio sp. TaxID=2212460 RepID=UPI0025ED1FFF|nr:AMP-binding protein [Propionivibrio sp.]MBK7355331.1 AMP-binding protein [Propionivibrio sp.]MBK8399726.1 AMP-binding protein [Propionivibrio sp.]MBK8743377.1 AMP-binding protein [Propionivibrio sp.]MBK8894598.1 AMP-binding protein [Propionivibrio sp.]MBL0207082.1 AMP-binding protein [Propionivibrio sp.]
MGPIQNYDDLPMNWVGDWAGRRAALTPHRVALYDSFTHESYTFQDLNERACRVGVYLTDVLGLRKGDVVTLICRNRIEPIDIYLACGKLGIILAPLSQRLKKPELDDLLARLQPGVLIHEHQFSELISALSLPASVRSVINIDDERNFFADVILKSEPREVNIPLAMNERCLYVHTGGTTAVPKICIVSYRQMVWNSFDILATGVVGLYRKVLITFPFFHVGGWNTFTPLLHAGITSVLMREFNPGLVLDLIHEGRVENFGAVEAMLQFLIAHPKFGETDFSGLKAITTAAAPCSKAVMQTFLDKGVPVSQTYGMTEAGPSNYAYIPRSDSFEDMLANSASIGTSMFHCDARIVDKESGREVKPGETGVLCLRSPHNFDGYLNDPARTDKIIRQDGWIYTGDLALQDADGLTYIQGRADNMFISGGENISPEEIELALMKHPAVAGAICAGVPDAKWGQAPVALVIFHAGKSVAEDELKAFCRDFLADYKVPKQIRPVAELPLTAVGKLNRNAVVAIFS